MTDQELKKLNRVQLLELLLAATRENEQLHARQEELERRLQSRDIQLENAGSIAEAALSLNGVFEAAESAAAQYLENVQRLSGEGEALCRRMEDEARKKAEAIRAEADAYSRQTRQEADRYQSQVMEKIQSLLREQEGLRFLLQSQGEGQPS